VANGTALTAVAIALFVAGVLLGFSAIASLARARLLRFLIRSLFSVVFVAAGGGLGLLVLGTHGMRALTKEETAARIKVVPTGPQAYDATVTFPDGRVQTFALAGDDIYLDAHIVKWTPLVNQLGLHTTYRLDRIGGRYRTLAHETTKPRTIHSLADSGGLDIIGMARRFPLAKEVFDAQYGSATYAPVEGPAELELKVSTSGLLLRPAAVPTPG
jgi:hypothetical protein